jgi:hypothetical protein
VAEERGRGVPGGRHRHPGADRAVALTLGEGERPAHGLGDRQPDGEGVGGVGQVLAQHGELVPSEVGQGRPGREDAAQPLCHPPQQLVPGVAAQRVVQRLEAVEVEEEHPDRLRPPFAPRQGMLQEVDEEHPVGQSRDRVVRRPVSQLRFHPLALDRVADGPGQRRRVHRRLGQVILRPRLNRSQPQLLVVPAGQDDHGQVGGTGQQAGERDHAAGVGQHEVEEDAAQRRVGQVCVGVGQPPHLHDLHVRQRRPADHGPDQLAVVPVAFDEEQAAGPGGTAAERAPFGLARFQPAGIPPGDNHGPLPLPFRCAVPTRPG